jgi:hypothetical protein
MMAESASLRNLMGSIPEGVHGCVMDSEKKGGLVIEHVRAGMNELG